MGNGTAWPAESTLAALGGRELGLANHSREAASLYDLGVICKNWDYDGMSGGLSAKITHLYP